MEVHVCWLGANFRVLSRMPVESCQHAKSLFFFIAGFDTARETPEGQSAEC